MSMKGTGQEGGQNVTYCHNTHREELSKNLETLTTIKLSAQTFRRGNVVIQNTWQFLLADEPQMTSAYYTQAVKTAR